MTTIVYLRNLNCIFVIFSSFVYTTACKYGKAFFFLAAKTAGREWLVGFTPSLHHHWFGFHSISPAPPLPDLLWYLPASPVATPSPQQPTCLGVVVWISVSDVVEYKQDRERRRGQIVKRKKERKQNTRLWSTSTAAVFYPSVYFYYTYNTHTTSALVQPWP